MGCLFIEYIFEIKAFIKVIIQVKKGIIYVEESQHSNVHNISFYFLTVITLSSVRE